jgi:tetratricopeptide (TPR) repeat protein
MDVMEYYQQGVELMEQKDMDAAITVFNRALEEYPDNVDVLRIRARAYELNGERGKAIADFTRMIAVDPENPGGWNARGNLYRVNREYDKAIADFTACILLSPHGDGRYWSNRGTVYYESGNMKAALADLNKAVECWEKLPDADPSCIALSLTQRGIVWWMLGEFDKALADFERGKDNGLDEDFVFHQLGYLYCQRHDFDKAIEFYSKVVEINGNNAESWRARGACYWNKCIKEKLGFWGKGGDIIAKAIEDFSKAIELDPGLAEAYFNRGVTRASAAQESNHLIKTIIKKKVKNDAERLLLLAQLERMGGKDLIPQFDALLRGLRFNREQAAVIVGECLGRIAKEDAEAAVKDLTRALELAPYNPDACYLRGLTYALLGQREKALADYERTCELNPYHDKALKKRDALRKLMKQEGRRDKPAWEGN